MVLKPIVIECKAIDSKVVSHNAHISSMIEFKEIVIPYIFMGESGRDVVDESGHGLQHGPLRESFTPKTVILSELVVLGKDYCNRIYIHLLPLGLGDGYKRAVVESPDATVVRFIGR